jgi:hypothetical protein
MLNAKEVPITGATYNRPPALDPGSYPARTVLIGTIGLQAQRAFKGEEKPPKIELLVTYELLDEFMTDEDGNVLEDKPRWLSERFPFNNLESERATSTKRYYTLDPKGEHDGDWSKLVGTPCNVNIVTEEGSGKFAGRIFEKISGISAMRPKEAEKAPDLVNPPVVFDFYEPDEEAFATIPKWILRRMTEALDYEGSAAEPVVTKLLEDTEEKEEAPKDKKGLKAAPEKDSASDDEIPW